MSILNVNQIQPVGSGQTVTISATNISAGSATVTAGTFSGGVTVTSGNLTGITSVSTSNLTVNGNAYPATGPLSNRNLIINGAMQVAQRGTSSTSTGYQTVDRFTVARNGVSVTQSQETLSSGDPYDEGFRYFLRYTNTATSSSAQSFVEISQYIESQNVAQSGWNYKSSSSYITTSFWVRSSLAGTYYVHYNNDDVDKFVYNKAFTLSSNTWTKVTHSIPGDSSCVFNNDNGRGLRVVIVPHYGTDYTDSSSQTDAWFTRTTSNYSPDFAQNWSNSASATFDITGLQLEVGTVATPFEHRSYGDELARCQRYYQKMIVEDIKFTCSRWDQSQGVGECNVYLRETMRLAPTFAFTGTWDTGGGWGGDPVMTLARPDVVVLTTTVSTVAASGVKVLRSETTDASISFTAEL